MKFLHHILGLGVLLAVMVKCGNSPDSPDLTGTTSQSGTAALEALEGIDSLMWKQPDSALTVMLEFAGNAEADSLDEFEGHYCQMLIAELLYKNYYVQSNREDLLKAVDYFDSIVAADGYKTNGRKADPPGVSLQKRNSFFDARAHYINGVGFYEKDSVVEACGEYLRTLDVMEEHFEERELVEHKAQFMSYTYNRLMELFSTQFMMDPAIECGEKSLMFCKIEPTSPEGISSILYQLGKQYAMMHETDKARQYYEQALENILNTDNQVFRDIVSSKALNDYDSGVAAESALDELFFALKYSDTEKERLHRYMTIGGIFFYEGIYDSALFYLEPVFEDNEAGLQSLAASFLRIIYDSIGNREQSDAYMRFLTNHKKPEGENEALVSKLETMFKNYQNQKQQKEAEEAREKSLRKTIGIIVPIAIVIALAVFIVVKLRSKHLLKQQQEKADRILGETEQEHEMELRLWQAEADKTLEETKRKYEEELEQLKAETGRQLEKVEMKHQQWMAKAKERHEEELREQKDQSEKEIEKIKKRHEEELETERLAYQKEQEALRQSLRQRETQVNILETALTQQRDESERQREAFLKEPICQHINDLLHGKHITTRDTSFKHETIALKEEDIKQLKDAVERHYKGFDNVLLSRYPGLRHTDLALCHLYLIGLGESDIAALRSRTYSGVRKHGENLQEKLGLDESVTKYVMRVAEGLIGHPERVLSEVALDESQGYSQKSSQKSQQRIVDLIKERPEITTTEMAEIIGMSRRSIVNITNRLQEECVIRRVGPDKGGHWEVIE